MVQLPKWLTRRKDGAFVVDPNIAYPLILKELKVKDGEVDQYWIECAYQCAKLKVQELITDTELDPRPDAGFVIIIDSGGDRKERWALRNFKPGSPGRDVNAATKGLQAKAHYRRIHARIV